MRNPFKKKKPEKPLTVEAIRRESAPSREPEGPKVGERYRPRGAFEIVAVVASDYPIHTMKRYVVRFDNGAHAVIESAREIDRYFFKEG